MKNKLLQRVKDRRGQVLVEFALILPVLMLVILGIVEFGRLFYGFSTLQNSVRYAADGAAKAPPHIGGPVIDDPEGRYYAVDLPDCGQVGELPCFLANIRAAVRRYAVLFPPHDPNIHVYFVPVDGIVSNKPGGIIEVEVEYVIPPITPVLRELAPLGVPVRVTSRRTIINVEFPYEEVTPIAGTPVPTIPTNTPVPGCNGKYVMENEDVNLNVYTIDIRNAGGGDGRGIVGLTVGWCPYAGRIMEVTLGGIPLLGAPADPPYLGVGGGGITIDEGETMQLRFVFENNLNQVVQSEWPAWHLTFDDYCGLWVGERNCMFPTPTVLPTLTPTPTPSPTGSPTPGPSPTPPPLCGMYIASGPIFAGNDVIFQVTNGGLADRSLDTIIVLWGSGWYPLTEVFWGGGSVWSAPPNKYYSARLSNLSGSFPANSTQELRFHFEGSPYWLSFQALFDGNCYISYSDPFQPTPPPMPTLTPTPVPGWIELDIVNLVPGLPGCATNSLTAEAIAYYPPAGNQNGDGIQRVVFQIFDPNNQEVYYRQENSVPYCLNGDAGGVCNNLSLGTRWPNNQPIISGTHTLQVTAYTTAAWGSYQRTVSTPFRICRQPLHLELVQFDLGGPGCAATSITAQAEAWDPQVCGGSCSDGQGISRVYFDIMQGPTLVYRRNDGSPCYCGRGTTCPCSPINITSGVWPSSDAGSGIPVVPGPHTLIVRAQATSGRTAEIYQPFEVCWDPCSLYTLISKTRSASNRATVTIRSNSPFDIYVTRVYVSTWNPSWNTLNRMRVLNEWRDIYDAAPPAEWTGQRRWTSGQQETVVFEFSGPVGTDVSALTGFIELENGCRIDY